MTTVRIVEELNSDFDTLSSNIYKNILDSRRKESNNKHDRFDSFTKNLLLWKLRDYNEKTVTFINNLLSLESACKREVNNESRQELSEYIVKTFISSEVNNKILNYVKSILKLNKPPDDDYESLKYFKSIYFCREIFIMFLKVMKMSIINLHATLKDLFNINKNIILQSDILN